jgi:hypothetical protein
MVLLEVHQDFFDIVTISTAGIPIIPAGFESAALLYRNQDLK